MGHSLLTPLLESWPFAIGTARMSSTITLPPSLADPSGGFDVPTQKCPPDRGSSDWVTDSPAPILLSPTPSESSLSSSNTSSYGSSIIQYPPTPPPEQGSPDFHSHFISPPPPSVGPQEIVHKQHNVSGLVTPPRSFDDSENAEGVSAISAKQSEAILDLLSTLFPRNALSAMPHAQGVSVSSPNLGTVFDGVILNLPGKPKTLYIEGKNAQHINLRESIVALLDLADEQLDCTALIIALEKSTEGLGDLLHSLMYVGGSVVTKPPFYVDPAYLLVGLEI